MSGAGQVKSSRVKSCRFAQMGDVAFNMGISLFPMFAHRKFDSESFLVGSSLCKEEEDWKDGSTSKLRQSTAPVCRVNDSMSACIKCFVHCRAHEPLFCILSGPACPACPFCSLCSLCRPLCSCGSQSAMPHFASNASIHVQVPMTVNGPVPLKTSRHQLEMLVNFFSFCFSVPTASLTPLDFGPSQLWALAGTPLAKRTSVWLSGLSGWCASSLCATQPNQLTRDDSYVYQFHLCHGVSRIGKRDIPRAPSRKTQLGQVDRHWHGCALLANSPLFAGVLLRNRFSLAGR